jgi:F-type H+-transporting ATPase subunit gamma
MANLRDIRRKIASVKNTQKITSAMKMVSAAKMKKAQDIMDAAKPFATKITEVVSNIGKRVSDDAHPFLEEREEIKTIGVIVITSDRGLCGAFNSNVMKEYVKFAEANKDKKIKVVTVGKTGTGFLTKKGAEIVEKFVDFSGKIVYDDAITIGDIVTKQFIDEEIDEVYVVYNEFKSVSLQIPTSKKILPLSFEPEVEIQEDSVDYIYEPAPELLLAEILPRFINFSIYSALMESVAGEHSARMAAMDNATRNAGELIGKLTLAYNKARQAAITTEILDIVNGAEALK